MSGDTPQSPFDASAAWGELVRLAQKIGTITDADIRSALKEALVAKADRFRDKLTSMPPRAAEVAEVRELFPDLPVQEDSLIAQGAPEEIREPTPEELEQVENCLRLAHLAQIRNNRAEARKHLEEAAKVAPNAPSVLEALGDEYAAAGRTKDAVEIYARAIKTGPKNIALEKKHAHAVFQAEAAAVGLSLSMELNQAETAASGKAILFMSVIVPGLGQMVAGQIGKGTAVLSGWLASWVPILLPIWGEKDKARFTGIDHLLAFVGVKREPHVPDPSTLAVMLFVVAVVLHLFAILDAFTRSGGGAPPKPLRPGRPVPPANLPFE